MPPVFFSPESMRASASSLRLSNRKESARKPTTAAPTPAERQPLVSARKSMSTGAAAHPSDPAGACPCQGGPAPPAFVGDAYACEAEPAEVDADPPEFGPSDRLWLDLVDLCAPTFTTTPHFVVSVGARIEDFIELRLMNDEPDEDIVITGLELYVR